MSNYTSLIWKIRLLTSCQAHLQDSPVAAGVAVPGSWQPRRPRVAGPVPARGGQGTTACPSAPKEGGSLPAAVPCVGEEGEGVPPIGTRAAGGAEPQAEGVEDTEVLVDAGGVLGCVGRGKQKASDGILLF